MKAICIKNFIPDSEKDLTQECLKMKVSVFKIYRIIKYAEGAIEFKMNDTKSDLISSYAFITKEELDKNFRIIKEKK